MINKHNLVRFLLFTLWIGLDGVLRYVFFTAFVLSMFQVQTIREWLAYFRASLINIVPGK